MKQFVIFNSKQEFWTGQDFSKNPAKAKLFCGDHAHSECYREFNNSSRSGEFYGYSCIYPALGNFTQD